jgi:hypothetical protein
MRKVGTGFVAIATPIIPILIFDNSVAPFIRFWDFSSDRFVLSRWQFMKPSSPRDFRCAALVNVWWGAREKGAKSDKREAVHYWFVKNWARLGWRRCAAAALSAAMIGCGGPEPSQQLSPEEKKSVVQWKVDVKPGMAVKAKAGPKRPRH